MTTTNNQDESFGVVPFCIDDGAARLLLVQHAIDDHWSFPKGHAEPGESLRTAAFREFEEETGITNWNEIEPYTYIEEYQFARDGVEYDKQVTYVLVQIACDAAILVQEGEIIQFQWLSEEMLEPFDLFESRKKIAQEVFMDLKKLME